MPAPDTTGAEESTTLTRRHVLAAGAAGAVALAGCSGTVDFNLDDVLISNDSSQPVSGSITVQDPGDETVLDETFELSMKVTESTTGNETTDAGGQTNGTGNETTDAGGQANETGNETTDAGGQTNETGENTTGDQTTGDTDPTEMYPDIFTESGEYTVAVELDEGSEIRGESSTEQTVTVSNIEEQSIVVGLDSGRDDIVGEFANSDVDIDRPIWVAVSDGEIEFDFSADNSTNSSG
jgi:hypothetical protein